jgi:hypothetical protein
MNPMDVDAALLDRGCAALSALGWPTPRARVAALRNHLRAQGVDPLPAVFELMRAHRLLCLGEMHDFAGRFMGAELVAAAAQAGARTLFIEVYDAQQPLIERFLRDGDHAQLPISAGGGQAVPYRFQEPYVHLMHTARAYGLRIVAIDSEGADYDERNVLMAAAIRRHLAAHDGRAVAVVGQLHLMRRVTIIGNAPSMATRLREHFGDAVVTIGRAVPDAMPEFSVWADVGDVSEPRLLQMAGSPFAELPSTFCAETLLGSDFDHLLFYPAAAVLDAPRSAADRQALSALHALAQSHNEAASAIEHALAGTGVSPAALLAVAQRTPQYRGQELLLAQVLDASIRAQALGPRPTPAQIQHSVAEMRSLAAAHAALAPRGSAAAATTGSAADQAKTFVESLDTKQRKVWEMQLIGGPSLQEVVAAEAGQGLLTLARVEGAVARARPQAPPPLPRSGWVDAETFYEVRYAYGNDFKRKVMAALNMHPTALPMQIRTPDGSKRLDVFRGGESGGVMIVDQSDSAAAPVQPADPANAIAEAFGIRDGSYGAIVVSYGSSDHVMSDKAQPYRRSDTTQSSVEPSPSKLPLRELQEAERRHPVNPAMKIAPTDGPRDPRLAQTPNAQRFDRLVANANNGGVLTRSQLYTIRKEPDQNMRLGLIALATQGWRIIERDFNNQLRDPATTLLPNRPSYGEFVSQMSRPPLAGQGGTSGRGEGTDLKAGTLDFIGSIEQDLLNSGRDAIAVNRALRLIDEKLIALPTSNVWESPELRQQVAAMLWRFRGLVERLPAGSS